MNWNSLELPDNPYYQDDAVIIYNADCRETLPSLPKVDLVLTDPPYGVGLEAKRAKLRGGGVQVRKGSYSFEDSPEYLKSVVIPVIELCRKLAKAVVVTPGTRNLWLYPPSEDMGCFFSAASTGMGKWGFTCMQPILYYGKDPYLAEGLGSRANSSGQTYPNDANTFDHPCAKPIRMMLWLVNRTSLPNQSIVDPFMGVGSTLVAAKQLNRKCIGIEIEEKYCEIAAKRCYQSVMNFDTLKERRR